MTPPPSEKMESSRPPTGPLARLAVAFAVSFPLSFIAYGLAAATTGHFLARRPEGGLDSTLSHWPLFVAVHMALWCSPVIVVGLCLRKRLGRVCLTGIAVSLLLTALLDGGHLVRRAYIGKF